MKVQQICTVEAINSNDAGVLSDRSTSLEVTKAEGRNRAESPHDISVEATVADNNMAADTDVSAAIYGVVS